MGARAAGIAAAVAVALTAPAAADDAAVAPPPHRLALAPGDDVDAVLARLAGHAVEVAPDRAWIDLVDVAGEGPPRVGVVERDGADLVLVAADGRWRLAGPLARPRIAGPRYTVWVHGDPVAGAARPTLRARRLGVLRPPPR